MRMLARLLAMASVACAGLTPYVQAASSDDACAGAREYRNRAAESYRQHDLPSAIAELRLAVNLCPAEPFPKFMLANALYRAGELPESGAMYRSFLESRPSHFEAHMCLGFVLFELGDRKGAMAQWWSAEGLEPQSPFAREALALGYAADADPDSALVQYRRAVALDSRYADPEALAIDIRWKAPFRAILKALNDQAGPKGDK